MLRGGDGPRGVEEGRRGVRPLAGAPVHQAHLARKPELGDLDRGELSARGRPIWMLIDVWRCS